MSYSREKSFLEDALSVLIQHFGIGNVQSALAKVVIADDQPTQKLPRRSLSYAPKSPHSTVPNALKLVRESDPEKYRLLSDFYSYLKNRKVLPQSEDIRHFAQLIGLKEIDGKSRKDMIPALMRFLLEQPTERLLIDLPSADTISEKQRQQGFSILTDKLLGEK